MKTKSVIWFFLDTPKSDQTPPLQRPKELAELFSSFHRRSFLRQTFNERPVVCQSVAFEAALLARQMDQASKLDRWRAPRRWCSSCRWWWSLPRLPGVVEDVLNWKLELSHYKCPVAIFKCRFISILPWGHSPWCAERTGCRKETAACRSARF